MPTADPYETLGVARDAQPDAIKSAFRKLARKHHPDVNPNDPDAEERFKQVNEAYQILSDPERRARYDRFGTDEAPTGGGPGADFFEDAGIGDLFEAFFGGGGGQRRPRSRARDGGDLQVHATIELADVLQGVDLELDYKRLKLCAACGGTGAEGGAQPETCPTCGGQGRVATVQNTIFGSVRTSTSCPTCGGSGQVIRNKCHICQGRGLVATEEKRTVSSPAGVEDGTVLRLTGAGHDGVAGGRPGDLYVNVSVRGHERFQRDGRNLRSALEITFAQAALGDDVKFETLDGEVEVEVPRGTQPGDTIRVNERGLPPVGGGKRGHLDLTVKVSVPKDLNEEQEAKLRDFSECCGEKSPKGKGGFLGGLFKKK